MSNSNLSHSKTSLFEILFHAAGRMGKKPFIIGLAVFAVLYVAQIFIMRAIGTNLFGFFASLTFLSLNFYMLYCLFGKRLHDMGRTVGLLFVMLAVLIVLAIILQLQAGGLDYFNAIMANPERQEDAVWMKEQHDIYQARLASNMGYVRWLLWLPPLALALFAALKPGEPGENRYGKPSAK